MMNWTALSTVVELLGVIAVLVTLVYLAAQTRQNGDAIRANTRQAILASDQEYLEAMRDDPDLELLRFKSDLTDRERIRLNFLYLTFARMRESTWCQCHNGVLDRPTWESYRNSIVLMYGSPNGMKWWKSYTSRPGLWNPAFVSMANQLLKDKPLVTESRSLRIFD
jgi:hypothetical protein